MAEVEERVFREAMDRGLADLAARLQEMADATPCEGSDGRRLRRTRRIGMEVDTTLGKARVTAVCGQCKSTGGWETPFMDRLFRGERREAMRRESEYFRSHADHMDYRTARREGVPIGSGAMESQCSQNRFKRRGQFWSKAGFASFLRAYVWYTNDELKCLYRRTA